MSAKYEWRTSRRAKCGHVGNIWEPPDAEVAKVGCPWCKARPTQVCRDRKGRVPPHAARYMAHHDATCETGRDWTRPAAAVAAGDERGLGDG